MSSRRDFLKYFGVGSTIVPFVGGSQIVVGRLIAEPKIEIIEPVADIYLPFSRSDVVGAEVILKMRDGTTRKQEHFDFSHYPIDFKQMTYDALTRAGASCPTCHQSCTYCEHKRMKGAYARYNL